MKESIGEQVARETKMLDVAGKILMKVTKVAIKRGGDAESPARRNVENGGVNELVGDAKSKLE